MRCYMGLYDCSFPRHAPAMALNGLSSFSTYLPQEICQITCVSIYCFRRLRCPSDRGKGTTILRLRWSLTAANATTKRRQSSGGKRQSSRCSSFSCAFDITGLTNHAEKNISGYRAFSVRDSLTPRVANAQKTVSATTVHFRPCTTDCVGSQRRLQLSEAEAECSVPGYRATPQERMSAKMISRLLNIEGKWRQLSITIVSGMKVGIRGGDVPARASQARQFQVKPQEEVAVGGNIPEGARGRVS